MERMFPYAQVLSVLLWGTAAVAAIDGLVLAFFAYTDRTREARRLHSIGVVCAGALAVGSAKASTALPSAHEEWWGLVVLLASFVGAQWVLIRAIEWLDGRAQEVPGEG